MGSKGTSAPPSCHHLALSSAQQQQPTCILAPPYQHPPSPNTHILLPPPSPPPPPLQALRVLQQQRVSAVAVLAGCGPSPNMRLVGNLSASDLRHLRRGGFGGLALSVKAFLASKPLALDQVCVWGWGGGPCCV